MNRISSVFALFALFYTAGPSVAEAHADPDSAAIHQVIEDYIIGWRDADIPRLSRAFEVNEGRILWISNTPDGEVLGSMTFGETLLRRKKQPAYGSTWKILDLDIVGKELAAVKVFISTKNGHYNDYLILQKIGAQWKIVIKTYVYFPVKK